MLVRRIIAFVLLFSTFFLFPSLPAQNPRRIDSMEKELRYDTRNRKALLYPNEDLAFSKKLGFIHDVSEAYKNLGFIILNRGDEKSKVKG